MALLSLPRMRGDRPRMEITLRDEARFTPHARGSTVTEGLDTIPHVVYPACAGIDRRLFRGSSLPRGLPRMRGDRPTNHRAVGSLGRFTPHARGSTLS